MVVFSDILSELLTYSFCVFMCVLYPAYRQFKGNSFLLVSVDVFYIHNFGNS